MSVEVGLATATWPWEDGADAADAADTETEADAAGELLLLVPAGPELAARQVFAWRLRFDATPNRLPQLSHANAAGRVRRLGGAWERKAHTFLPGVDQEVLKGAFNQRSFIS